LSQLPVFYELLVMQGSPFDDQTQGSWRQLSFQNSKVLDANCNLALSIACVEVRWGMIPIEHCDNDPIEPANLWQYPIPSQEMYS
jgi:hypothetical protein